MNGSRLETVRWIAATLAFAGAAACSDSGTGGSLSLSLSARRTAVVAAPGVTGNVAAPAVVAAGDTTIIALGSDTIVLHSLDVVLRKVELKRVEAASCDSIPDNGDCEEFEAGPVLASFPLGSTNAAAAVTVAATAGQYNQVEFEIHKTDTTSSQEAAFIAQNPDFKDISIRVTGTFNHTPFTFTSDLDASEEIALSPPLDVTAGSSPNVTIRMDVSTWFVSNGALIDPASANTGGQNEGIVKDNIKQSVEAFEDDNHDGLAGN